VFYHASILSYCCVLDSFNEFKAHLKKREVLVSVKNLLKRFSDVSRSAALGERSSLNFLFTKEINVRYFLVALVIHYWPEQSLELTRDLALIDSLKRATVNFLGAMHRLVVQLSGSNGWAGVSRDDIIGFNGVLHEYYNAFIAWKANEDPKIKTRLECAMSGLIMAIVQLNETIDAGGDHRQPMLDECMTQLQRLQGKYVKIFGAEEFEEFTRRRAQYV
jgi:hypothetical protein